MRKVTWRRFDQSAKQLVVGQTTIKYDEPEVENVALRLHPLVTFLTSGSSYLKLNVALTTVHHLNNEDLVVISWHVVSAIILKNMKNNNFAAFLILCICFMHADSQHDFYSIRVNLNLKQFEVYMWRSIW